MELEVVLFVLVDTVLAVVEVLLQVELTVFVVVVVEEVDVVDVVVEVEVVVVVVVENDEEELVVLAVLLHVLVVDEHVVVQALGYASGQFCLNMRLSISTDPPRLLVS